MIFDIAPFSPLGDCVWSQFPKLRAISLDCHEDLQSVRGGHGLAYRDIVSTLPQRLRYLEIRHAHGPDVNVIGCVKRYCPNLESLWLGRCTAFNRTPACQFWKSFPFEHDSYFSWEGSDSYAVGTQVRGHQPPPVLTYLFPPPLIAFTC
jgi:hypothetical protein